MRSSLTKGVVALALLASAVGCNNTATDPNSDRTSIISNSGKNPQTLSDNCVDYFEGITNCALGGAQLSASADGVVATGMQGEGDGFASNFASATRWTQAASISFPDSHNGSLTYSGTSDNGTLSSLNMSQDPGAQRYHIAPGFTGSASGRSNYDIAIYDDGVYQGGSTDVSSARFVDYYWGRQVRPWYAVPPIIIIIFARVASTDDPNNPAGDNPGACQWRMSTNDEVFNFTLPDGRLISGDEIVFTERIEGGAYPYNRFEQISTRGSVASYTVVDESSAH